jgi:hypothetical protein
MARKLSQVALIRILENNRYNATISQPYLSRLEDSACDKFPSINVLAALSDALETTMDCIVRGGTSANSNSMHSVDMGVSLRYSALTDEQKSAISALLAHFEQENFSGVDAEGMQGYIYFVHAPESCRIKIGYTTEPYRRINALTTSSPFALETLCVIPGTVAEEKALHRRFSHIRQHREWFTDCPESREYIDAL